ncbi:MAG: MFS transporter [Burkholderiales bacterium]|nr:MFS transporter [Burkholderiales bacterium]
MPPPPAPARARAPFVLAFALAHFGIYAALMMPPLIGLALRVAQIDAARKSSRLALVLSLGAAVAMATRPIAGALSDRAGRRKPWLVGGLLAGCAGLALVADGGYERLVGGWCLAQFGFNVSLAALAALLHDCVPDAQRGRVMGAAGLCMALGTLAGAALARGAGSAAAFGCGAALATVTTFALLLSFAERGTAAAPRRPPDPASAVRRFLIDPRGAPGFAWVFLSRFLATTGHALMLSYQVYYLADGLRVAPAGVPEAVFGATLVSVGSSACASVAGGWLSDRWRRRKAFLFAAALIDACGLFWIGRATDYAGFLAGVALIGLGGGLYLAVGLALVTALLPRGGADAAKDLGLFNLSSTLPQAVAPALAPLLLGLGGGAANFAALMTGAAALAALGAVAVLPLRRVR